MSPGSQLLQQSDHYTDDTFDLASFLGTNSTLTAGNTSGNTRLLPEACRPQASPAIGGTVADLAVQFGSLSAMVMDLRIQLAAATAPASTSVVQPVRPVTQPLIAAATTPAPWTLAADGNYPLPPAHLRELRISSFPSTVHRN
ncbi:hypothetical protein PHYSODRAFT_327576 [Phytophthora sojae]|uniref:Uncharacterized protein n=1 Tax=Phytophthora sojae (strain P6497) TaxID=1094619 RepID=G4Z2V0_PHYSP|nr:hypothetical protein PHYSODRAFT_327576 [Phytophthora sojae]EGZ19283.1 hypothetical protein PHYSODRAFT_327576 [Phytophthora sojae]|eukprot:XP_009522000.1 hypothetical protein PHYSODRAFT_327576 [Phytophthora sojae]